MLFSALEHNRKHNVIAYITACKQVVVTGMIAMLCGISLLSVFSWKRISREIEKQRLLKG